MGARVPRKKANLHLDGGDAGAADCPGNGVGELQRVIHLLVLLLHPLAAALKDVFVRQRRMESLFFRLNTISIPQVMYQARQPLPNSLSPPGLPRLLGKISTRTF